MREMVCVSERVRERERVSVCGGASGVRQAPRSLRLKDLLGPVTRVKKKKKKKTCGQGGQNPTKPAF